MRTEAEATGAKKQEHNQRKFAELIFIGNSPG